MVTDLRTPQLEALAQALRAKLRSGYELVHHDDEARLLLRSIHRELEERAMYYRARAMMERAHKRLELDLCASCPHTLPDACPACSTLNPPLNLGR